MTRPLALPGWFLAANWIAVAYGGLYVATWLVMLSIFGPGLIPFAAIWGGPVLICSCGLPWTIARLRREVRAPTRQLGRVAAGASIYAALAALSGLAGVGYFFYWSLERGRVPPLAQFVDVVSYFALLGGVPYLPLAWSNAAFAWRLRGRALGAEVPLVDGDPRRDG